VNILHILAERNPAGTVLVVTHGGLICNVLATWFGGGPGDWRNWEPHNCAISILVFESGHWQAIVVNDISHLPIEAIAPKQHTVYANE